MKLQSNDPEGLDLLTSFFQALGYRCLIIYVMNNKRTLKTVGIKQSVIYILGIALFQLPKSINYLIINCINKKAVYFQPTPLSSNFEVFLKELKNALFTRL